MLTPHTRVYVHKEATDMRKSFEGLTFLARNVVQKDVMSGHLFLFFNRTRTSVKVLYWDKSGFALWYKQLQQGTFRRPAKDELTGAELVCVLEGIDFEKTPKRKRFSYEFSSAHSA